MGIAQNTSSSKNGGGKSVKTSAKTTREITTIKVIFSLRLAVAVVQVKVLSVLKSILVKEKKRVTTRQQQQTILNKKVMTITDTRKKRVSSFRISLSRVTAVIIFDAYKNI